MYGFDETTESSGSGGNLMSPGINENVKLIDIKYENSKQDGTGTDVLRFYFEDSDGATFNHTEFPIDRERVVENAKKWGEDPKDLLQREESDFGARIKHIVECFVPAEKAKVKASSFEEFCEKVIELLGESYQDVPVRLKVILNKKDFLTLPRKTFTPFIERMDQEGSKMKINPKYDKIEYSEAKDESSFEDGASPFEESGDGEATEEEGELQF